MAKENKGVDLAGKTPAEIYAILEERSKAVAREEEKEARKARPFDEWPQGSGVGVVTEGMEEATGRFGRFAFLSFGVEMLGDEEAGGELVCVVPSAVRDAAASLREGDRFAWLYRGKRTRGSVTVHDLTILRLS